MRKITKESSKAFVNHGKYKKDNTEVFTRRGNPIGRRDTEVMMHLHGNRIASMLVMSKFSKSKFDPKVTIDLCGWHTPTTRERINGVLEALGYDFRIAQRKGEQVLIRRARRRWTFKPNGENSESYIRDILKLSDDSFDPDFAERVFNSKEFVSGTDLNAITDF